MLKNLKKLKTKKWIANIQYILDNILNMEMLEEKEESYRFLFDRSFFAEKPDCSKCGSATR